MTGPVGPLFKGWLWAYSYAAALFVIDHWYYVVGLTFVAWLSSVLNKSSGRAAQNACGTLLMAALTVVAFSVLFLQFDALIHPLWNAAATNGAEMVQPASSQQDGNAITGARFVDAFRILFVFLFVLIPAVRFAIARRPTKLFFLSVFVAGSSSFFPLFAGVTRVPAESLTAGAIVSVLYWLFLYIAFVGVLAYTSSMFEWIDLFFYHAFCGWYDGYHPLNSFDRCPWCEGDLRAIWLRSC